MSLENVYNTVISCSKCGFCQPACPTYAITGVEHQVARGRHQLVRGIIEDKVELDKKAKDMIFECLMCNACYSNCFPAIKTDHVIAEARHAYIKKFGQPALQKFIFKSFLRNPAQMNRLLKLASLGKNSGLSGLVQLLRIVGWFGRNLAHAEKLLERIPFYNLRDRLAKEKKPVEKPIGKVAYFVGCGINYAQPDVGMASVRVLQNMGFEVEVLPNLCCGLPAYAYGDLDSVNWFVEQNINILNQTNADVILTDCASCASFLKTYPEMTDKQQIKDMAETVSEKISDMTVWVQKNYDLIKFPPNGKLVKMTWHDPCHLAHHLKEKATPRKLLNDLSHVDFVEMEKSDMCCGGAGSYNLAHPEKSTQLLDIKLDNVCKTGAKVLVTACPACIMQLEYGVRENKIPVQVKHINQVIAEHL